MRRVVITGLGPVSAIGVGAAEFEEALRAGRSGISEITSFDTTGFPHRRAGEIVGFDPAGHVRTLKSDQWGRTSLMAASAARLAVEDAGIDPDLLAAARAGPSRRPWRTGRRRGCPRPRPRPSSCRRLGWRSR